jgi:hypothetical protein
LCPQCEDADAFVDDVRADDEELARPLRVEPVELESLLSATAARRDPQRRDADRGDGEAERFEGVEAMTPGTGQRRELAVPPPVEGEEHATDKDA